MHDESYILSLLQQKNHKGISLLYENYSSAIFGVILRIIPDKGLAEEILQKTFVKAWNKFDSYNSSKSSLYTWLSAIARNASIDIIRLKKYQDQNKTESLDPNVYDYKSSYTSLDHLDTNKLLKQLDEKYRIVLDMMYLQGYSQSEIAKKMDIPLGTVKTRIRSAINILKETLKNEKKLFIGFLLLTTLILLLCL